MVMNVVNKIKILPDTHCMLTTLKYSIKYCSVNTLCHNIVIVVTVFNSFHINLLPILGSFNDLISQHDLRH